MKEVFIINAPHLEQPLRLRGFQVACFLDENQALAELDKRKYRSQILPVVILYDIVLEELDRENSILQAKIPVIIIHDEDTLSLKEQAQRAGAIDFFPSNINTQTLTLRINAIRPGRKKKSHSPVIRYGIPLGKRLFDIAVSSFLILLLSPLFILIGLLIKFGSKGPIFYSSPRVGTGYKIFPFYKFRSMRVDADQLLNKMKHLNHYKAENIFEDQINTPNDGPILVGDDQFIPETTYNQHKEMENKQAFMKINKDPRITKVGHFIRKTSIDELPQLFNVLLGHMSIVGNRPLPLYEAEKLTSDDWALRFMAPAGITGLWQVTERGKSSTSEDSRKELDVIYAKKYSMWMDLKILIKTPLALFQQEDV